MTDICANQMNLASAGARKLSDQQCEKLFWACLEILERTGVRLYEQEALDLLKKAGVSAVDGNRVRIPAGMVEKALTTVPKRVTMYDRNGNRVMPIEGHRSFFGSGSDCIYIVDHRSNERRKAVLQDVVDGMIVCDALPHIDFVMCMFLPSDVRQDIMDRYQMAAMLNNTTKPIFFVTTEMSGCIDAVEMAEAVVGGPENLRHKPMAACYINVTTGLRHNQEALQKLLYLSGKGLPFTYIPHAQGGTTAPITLAGSMAVWQAGAMVGLVISQLKREGSPFIMPGWSGVMLDMKTTVQPYADPEKRAQGIDYAHYLGLPMFNLGGCSDSKLVDQQAAAEAALTLFTDALFGANLVHDLGYLESGLSGSLAQLVICDEIVSWLEAFMKGIEINDETLALDLIDEIGPDGQYLDNEHTYENFRKRWYPSLFEREDYENWMNKGSKDLRERAVEKVSDIMANNKPAPLDKDAAKAIQGIIERAES